MPVDRARFNRAAVPLIKEACAFLPALIVFAAIMGVAALVDIWIWVPHAFR